jgi:hypothetical protein
VTAINYARHRLTGQYVFLAAGARARREWLTEAWVWHRELTDAQVGDADALYWVECESPTAYCERYDHGPQLCERCRQARIAAGRVERWSGGGR